jgi:hypothetical protein
MTKRKTKFERDCEEVSRKFDVDVYFFREEKSRSDCFEDDGYLHIQKGLVRACFAVGLRHILLGAQQNENTRFVLEALGMSDKITDRVLVGEYDEDDYDDGYDRCWNCGAAQI